MRQQTQTAPVVATQLLGTLHTGMLPAWLGRCRLHAPSMAMQSNLAAASKCLQVPKPNE